MNSDNNRNTKVTWAQAVRDVLNTAMNRGQLPILIVMLAFLFVLYRLPSEDISKLTFLFLEYLKTGYIVGYILFIVTVLAWIRDAKRNRRNYAKLEKEFKKYSSKMKNKIGVQR
ncbi:hypothetical protein [Actinobacillus porcinus]|uniref:Uncharacterized protein n=1 Tax=Actinobacillus porcinus TaxID=51048 RepID=A0ABY6TNB9_9PAST|nr:hypothetical protein [Actinobacillus porcinus]MCI5764017.1 hypothetical protein [Actinobacillus porcinus]MDY5421398.1 hypothetical protein [Actinobacillus porcinus]VFY93900.1 Uncharacterised protein [Actinobacillus porcinus]VTU09361.1 Uncharacterised protein [Actinobacillus porcinus]